MADKSDTPALVALTRAEIATAEARHYEVEDEGHCGFCDKPKPTYAPWPCTTTRALAGNAAFLALVERIEQGLAEHHGRGQTCRCERCNLLRGLLSPPKEPTRC